MITVPAPKRLSGNHFAHSEASTPSVPLALSRFSKFTWLVLLYNLAAVAWGVYVRASKSGDGCGNHWPLCDGDSTPLNGPVAKIVEASHRASTGLVGLLVAVMVVWAIRSFPKGHLARKASYAALGLTLLEGLIGAALVKFALVTTNDSAARAGIMSFHVVSTFLLLGSIAVAALAGMGIQPLRLRGQVAVLGPLGFAAISFVLLGVSGAISALGHTLNPVDDVLKAALNPATHWMVRLQPLHPLLAVAVGLYLTLAAGMLGHLRPDRRVTQAATWMVGIYAAQMAIGLFSIYMKAPIWLQMIHLAAADASWIAIVTTAVFALAQGIERVESRPAVPDPEAVALRGAPLLRAYFALTKPRVISLLLFTTLTSAVAAKGAWPGGWLFLAVAVGGYMAAGAANAINMVMERDLDFAMKRTSTRPTVTQTISSRNVLFFAFALGAGSFALLWSAANLLSAVMAFSGLVFYVVVYTMLLKRRTPMNIVVGGAAGAFPPLVGWAAVTNGLPPLALYLFAIIFLWTPVHFWALAILLKDDYAAAGVPMLPVVKGERATALQIGFYTAGTVLVTMLPFALPGVGWTYVAGAAFLNVVLVFGSARLWQRVDRPRASWLFHYSMLYLAILFLVFAIDRVVVVG